MATAVESRARARRGRGTLSWEEFLALAEPERAEWVDGRLVEMPGITRTHWDVVQFIVELMRPHAGAGVILGDPFLMRLSPDGPARAPDLIYISSQDLGRLTETYLDGPSDVAVEVISPGSRSIDRAAKFYEYEAGGVREYWLIDPERLKAEFYRLGEDSRYELVSTPGGIFRSEAMPGFALRVEWLWTRPALATLDTPV